MSKTLEETIREKLATGYDPVQLTVSARAVSEEDVQVSIEGTAYAVRGNTVTELNSVGRPITTHAEDSAGQEPAVVSGEPSGPIGQLSNNPEPMTAEQQQEADALATRIHAACAAIGAHGYGPSQDASKDGAFDWLDESGNVIATGTLEEIEAYIAKVSAEQPAA